MGLEYVRLEVKDIGAGDLTLGDWIVLKIMKLGEDTGRSPPVTC